MRGPWGPHTNTFLLYMCSPSWYLPIACHLGLNHLDFCGYNKMYPDIAHFEAYFANLGAF